MIKRIVKMKFKREKIEEFKKIFFEYKAKILQFNGCHHVELLHDCYDETIICTMSLWDNDQCLQDYRNSDFFKVTWSKTKNLFEARAEANSYNIVEEPTDLN